MRRIKRARDYIASKTDFKPDVVITLGSGLDGYAHTLSPACVFDYSEIPGFPAATAPGHRGRLVFAGHAGKRLAVFQGRHHCYEGYEPAETVIPLRALLLLGAKVVLLVSASGGINPGFAPGQLVTVTDHINFSGKNVLNGKNLDELGPRFPDMSRAYSPRLNEILHHAAAQEGISLKEGVYGYMAGPSYETPAEIRALRILGADVVGMSTVHEITACAHAGAEAAAVSCVTNLAAGVSKAPLSLQEVFNTGNRAAPGVIKLLDGFLRLLPGVETR